MTERLHFHALEKEMATHSGVLAWRIPGTGEPGGLPDVCGVTQSRTRLKRLSMVVSRSTAKPQTDLHVPNKVINLGLDSSVWLLGRKAMINLLLLLLSHFSRVRLCETP